MYICSTLEAFAGPPFLVATETMSRDDFRDRVRDVVPSGFPASYVVQTARSVATGLTETVLVHSSPNAMPVDLIIVATSTPDMIFPSTASIVQRKLGVQALLVTRGGEGMTREIHR